MNGSKIENCVGLVYIIYKSPEDFSATHQSRSKKKTQTTFPNHVRNFIAFFLHQKSKSLLLLLFHLSQRICKCCAYGYYVSSGLVSVIYDFHAVIGTVPDTDSSALDKIIFCFFPSPYRKKQKTKQQT